jgi:hypothetical protein
MGCNFFAPSRIIAVPKEKAFLIPFFEDGASGSFMWYLYLDKDGRHCVVGSHHFFDQSGNQAWIGTLPRGTWFCAASFQEFVYRIWIESEIWYASSMERRPFSPAEQAYVDHYRQRGLAPNSPTG